MTDPAIVGTIATCPKCNSMVQIEPPETAASPHHPQVGQGQVAVGHSGVDSQAITEEAIAPPEVGELSDEASSKAFVGDEQSGASELPPIAPPDWQSDRTRRSRQIALVATVSIIGLLSSVVLFGWFVRSWNDLPANQVAEASAGAEQSTESSPDPSGKQQQTVALGPDVESESVQSPADSSTEPPDSSTEPPDSSTEPPDSSTEPPDSSTEPPDSSTEIAQRQADRVSDSEETVTRDVNEAGSQGLSAQDSLPPADLMPQSPLFEEPIANELAEGPDADSGPDADAGAGAVAGMQELPPELQKFMPFLLDEGLSDQPTLKAPPTMDEVQIDAAAEDRDGPLVQDKPKPLNLKADLAVQVAMATDGYPLTDLMLLVSQITGVPIQIDWVSFDLAGIDISGQVPTKKDWQTARQLLDSTAAALGAEIREEQSLVVLTLTDDTFARATEKITNLDDFGPSKASVNEVVNAFFGGEEVGPSRQQQQLAALAIESLRRMRGVPPKVSDERLMRWAQNTQQSVEWPVIVGGETNPQFDAPITIAALLRRSAKRNQATCVVNWYDLNRRAAAPEQLVFPRVGSDVASTLSSALAPFGLQVRRVDANHWWVGTEPTYDRLTAVVWTPPLGEERERFVQRITQIMGGASSDVFRLAIDDQSDRALLLLPRFIVRQLPKITDTIAAK